MKKHFVFALLLMLSGGIGIQAQNINPFQVDDFCIHEEASNAPNVEQSEDVIYTVCKLCRNFSVERKQCISS